MTLPLVHLNGTPYDQGVRHGRELKGRIGHNIDVYLDRIEKEGKLPGDEAFSRARQYLNAIRSQDADYFDEMRGISEGSGIDLDGIALLSVRYEIMYNQFRVNAPGEGCTSFTVLPERSAEGHLILGQNWDWIPQAKGAVIHSIDPSGLEILSFTEAGIPGGKIGFNSHGVGLVVNGMLSTDDDWSNLRKPFHVRCHEILRSKDIEVAIDVVKGTGRAVSANYLIVQTPDRVVDIEAAPAKVHESRCTGGLLVHTNHFVEPDEIAVTEPQLEDHHYSYTRYARMDDLLRSNPKVSLDDLRSNLRDHVGRPHSICRHIEENKPPEKHYATVASVIMDLNAGIMEISDGPPCENEYQRVSLEGYHPKRSRSHDRTSSA